MECNGGGLLPNVRIDHMHNTDEYVYSWNELIDFTNADNTVGYRIYHRVPILMDERNMDCDSNIYALPNDLMIILYDPTQINTREAPEYRTAYYICRINRPFLNDVDRLQYPYSHNPISFLHFWNSLLTAFNRNVLSPLHYTSNNSLSVYMDIHYGFSAFFNHMFGRDPMLNIMMTNRYEHNMNVVFILLMSSH